MGGFHSPLLNLTFGAPVTPGKRRDGRRNAQNPDPRFQDYSDLEKARRRTFARGGSEIGIIFWPTGPITCTIARRTFSFRGIRHQSPGDRARERRLKIRKMYIRCLLPSQKNSGGKEKTQPHLIILLLRQSGLFSTLSRRETPSARRRRLRLLRGGFHDPLASFRKTKPPIWPTRRNHARARESRLTRSPMLEKCCAA